MKKWRCTVCNYVHTGDEPPDVCPVCGAPKDAFELIEGELPPKTLKRKIIDLHLHPISSHFPQALFPVSFFFLFLFYLMGEPTLELTSFYILILAVIATPFTSIFGLVDWQLRYEGAKALVFKKKMIGSALLIPISIIVLGLRFLYGDAIFDLSIMRWVYFAGHVIQCGIVLLLGYLGGRIVFG